MSPGRAVLAVVAATLVVLPCDLARAERETSPSAPEEGAYGATPEELLPYRQTGSYYWRYFEEPTPYRGSGRSTPVPKGLESVKIGLLAPFESELDSEIGQAMLHGATMAVDEANARGGFRETIPFELIERNDSGLWGAASNTLVELAFEQRVWGIIGSVDGGNTHVALRVALKAEVPIVNTSCTDPTLTETAIPWIVRCYPDDRQHGYHLARRIFQDRGYGRVAIFRSNDKYGRMGVGEFRDAARRLGNPIVLEVRFNPGESEFAAQLDRIRKMEAEAVVLWASAADAGRIVAAMRATGLELPVYGTERLVSPVFLETAGSAAEGVLASYPMDPDRDDRSWIEFEERYTRRYGASPDAFATFTYDGTQILLQAIERAGLNRALIRDELTALERHGGVSGPMRFDSTHNNLGWIRLLEVRDGGFEVATR